METRTNLLKFCLILFIFCGLIQYIYPVADPEIIQWRAPGAQFITTLHQGVLGRPPTALELQSSSSRVLSWNNRFDLFWELINSFEYQNSRWARLRKIYHVWFDTRRYTINNSVRTCNCYYHSENSHGGFMPAQQYTSLPYYSGPYSFGVARALVLIYAAADSQTCPYNNCGGGVPILVNDGWAGTWSIKSYHTKGPLSGKSYNSRVTVTITADGSYVIWGENKWNCTIKGNTISFAGTHPSGGRMEWEFVRNGNFFIKKLSFFKGYINDTMSTGNYEGKKE